VNTAIGIHACDALIFDFSLSAVRFICFEHAFKEPLIKQGIAPGAARRYAPADGSSIHKSRWIYVRPRTHPQSAHLWWPVVPISSAAAPWDRQTEGSRYSKMPPPYGGGITNVQRHLIIGIVVVVIEQRRRLSVAPLVQVSRSRHRATTTTLRRAAGPGDTPTI